jgi:DGQHR domain-containing protein
VEGEVVIDIRKHYGNSVELHNCIVGFNLNLIAIRGFARLDVLAAISAPDYFDQHLNPEGTQRDLNKGRSREALDFAMESMEVDPRTKPRAFTEVILNVRDKSVVEIFDLENQSEINFHSVPDDPELSVKRVNVRIDLGAMNFPVSLYDPQISRVDGNHRLSSILDEDPEVLADADGIPLVPFALFVGLNPDQERAIFRDINSKQFKMETAHLDQIRIKLEGKELLAAGKTKREWALWIANKLTQTGEPFEGLVFFGGRKQGMKELGIKPMLKLNSLRDTVKYSIDDYIEQKFFITDPQEEVNMTPQQIDNLRLDNAEMFSVLLGWYWDAVKQAFPEAWQDKKNHILFQSIGLFAFGSFAARLLKILLEDNLDKLHIDATMAGVAKKVNLSRKNAAWEGVAGITGGKKVLKALESALDLPGANLTVIKTKLRPSKSKLEE